MNFLNQYSWLLWRLILLTLLGVVLLLKSARLSDEGWPGLWPNLLLNLASEFFAIVITVYYIESTLKRHEQSQRKRIRSHIEHRLRSVCLEILHRIVFSSIGLTSRDYPGVSQDIMIIEYEEGDLTSQGILEQFLREVKPKIEHLLTIRSPSQWSHFAKDVSSLMVRVEN